MGDTNTPRDWIQSLSQEEKTGRKRHIDVSHDMRFTDMGLSAAVGDAERTEALTRIPPWVLAPDETKKLFEDGHGTAPNLMYAKGMPITHHPNLTNVNKTGVHTHPRRSQIIKRPRMQYQTYGEDREILFNRRGLQEISGKRRFRRHPHRPRGYHARYLGSSSTSEPHSPPSALTWSKQEPARAPSTLTRTPTPRATTTAGSSSYWSRS